jgi:hypothetical protein
VRLLVLDELTAFGFDRRLERPKIGNLKVDVRYVTHLVSPFLFEFDLPA